MICNNFCLIKTFVQHIFKALFAKKKNEFCYQGTGQTLGAIKKMLCIKSCVLWFVTTFVWIFFFFFCTMHFYSSFCQKTELCHQGRGHIRGPILLIYNPSRDFYHIRSHTKFGWASSIIFWVIVYTDRQTDTQTDDVPKMTFLDSATLKMWRFIKISISVFWTNAIGYFILRIVEKVKNLFRKTEQYFLDTLHICEAAITP